MIGRGPSPPRRASPCCAEHGSLPPLRAPACHRWRKPLQRRASVARHQGIVEGPAEAHLLRMHGASPTGLQLREMRRLIYRMATMSDCVSEMVEEQMPDSQQRTASRNGNFRKLIQCRQKQ